MTVKVVPTDLNVDPAILQVAVGDVIKRGFDAGEAFTGVTYDLIDLDTNTTTNPSGSTLGNVATPTLSSWIEGHTYRLEVHFVNAAGVTWTRTLYLQCVA